MSIKIVKCTPVHNEPQLYDMGLRVPSLGHGESSVEITGWKVKSKYRQERDGGDVTVIACMREWDFDRYETIKPLHSGRRVCPVNDEWWIFKAEYKDMEGVVVGTVTQLVNIPAVGWSIDVGA